MFDDIKQSFFFRCDNNTKIWTDRVERKQDWTEVIISEAGSWVTGTLRLNVLIFLFLHMLEFFYNRK